MRRQKPWIGVLFASAGLVTCVLAILRFFRKIAGNEFPVQDVRDHYLAVGRAYSDGFFVGFFLCFFLVLAAIGVAALLANRRRRAPVPAHSAAAVASSL